MTHCHIIPRLCVLVVVHAVSQSACCAHHTIIFDSPVVKMGKGGEGKAKAEPVGRANSATTGRTSASSAKSASPKGKVQPQLRLSIEPNETFIDNAVIWQQTAEAYNNILDHSIFENILAEDPLPITKGAGVLSGHQSVFNQLEFSSSMAEKQHYKAAGNIMKVNWLWSATPKVPIRASSIQHLREHYFAAPGPFPGEVIVAAAPTDKPMDSHGRMKCLSPEEMRIALLIEVADRITKGADEDELQEWHTTFLTVSFHFMDIVSDNEQTIQAINLREHAVVNYSTMARTARQWCYLLHSLREKGPTKSDAEFAESLRAELNMAKNSEAISTEWVKASREVYDTLFVDPESTRLIVQGEEDLGVSSPLSGY